LTVEEFALLESIPDAIVVSGQHGEITFANRKVESLTGYRPSDLIGRTVEILVPTGLRRRHAQLRRAFYRHGLARAMGEADADLSLRRKDGSCVAVEISLGPVGANTMAVIRDVTERHLLEKAMEHRALHDPLTDLANRTLFFDRLRQSIFSARRDGSAFALVMLDLDRFKSINDHYGHAAGDEVLRQLAARLRRGMRATDTAARLGGDEFAWILPRVTSLAAAQRMVRKRLIGVQKRFAVERHKIKIGVSAGIVMYPNDGRSTDSLVRNADTAMYLAKRERDQGANLVRPKSR
jgi:diguanylate cyclase (GGDEF)-like protein/PAS domain S-box-containing protein